MLHVGFYFLEIIAGGRKKKKKTQRAEKIQCLNMLSSSLRNMNVHTLHQQNSAHHTLCCFPLPLGKTGNVDTKMFDRRVRLRSQ